MTDANDIFSPIKTTSLAGQVEQRIRDYFTEHKLKIGDPIPKEVDLAAALGVSRNVVREALSHLKMLGLIQSKKRRGSVIAEPDLLGTMKKVLDPSFLGPENLQDLFELRIILEMGIAELLFLRCTKNDLVNLGNIAIKEKQSINDVERISWDIEFHATLYKISGNEMLHQFQRILYPVFHYVYEKLKVKKQKLRPDIATHFDLIDILRSGTSEEYRKAIYSHLTPHFDILQP